MFAYVSNPILFGMSAACVSASVLFGLLQYVGIVSLCHIAGTVCLCQHVDIIVAITLKLIASIGNQFRVSGVATDYIVDVARRSADCLILNVVEEQ